MMFIKFDFLLLQKNKGKSGGERVITFVKIIDRMIFLISIYNKGEIDSLSDKEIKELLKDYL